ncbi:hypothetical protein AND4_08169 [Vibrio sp. AND4]|nr:hypothetical protein AND4_08169 [Vibrio sp. AND4]
MWLAGLLIGMGKENKSAVMALYFYESALSA